MFCQSFFVFFAIFVTIINGKSVPTQEWTNEVSLDKEETFKLKWSTKDPQWLVMEMSAPTKGYVSIGFSPDGGMNNSDIVLGWVDSEGKAQLKDLHGIGNTKPVEDAVQNYELIFGTESDALTTIQFRRRYNTCDDVQDKRMDENSKIIWAYNKEDPKLADDDGVFRPPYHFTSRGSAVDADKAKIVLSAEHTNDNCLGLLAV